MYDVHCRNASAPPATIVVGIAKLPTRKALDGEGLSKLPSKMVMSSAPLLVSVVVHSPVAPTATSPQRLEAPGKFGGLLLAAPCGTTSAGMARRFH
jgi:hypothetical protein